VSLDAIKARAAVVAGKPDNREPTEKEFDALIDGAVHDVPTLVAALEAVLELHKEVQWKESWPTCIHCNSGEGSPLAYPCPTVTAIHQALGEGEK
jgi:hypothetical protein